VPDTSENPKRAVDAGTPVTAAQAAALDASEEFQRRLMTVHAPEFAAIDLTMAQAKLLYVVAATAELSMSSIAHRLGVTLSTASGAVDHLVSAGYLTRADDPANRRQVRVSVTPAGFERLEQLRELSSRQLTALFSVVSDDDLAIVERATRIMTDALSHLDTTTPDPEEPR
jgi:DNA-binding MarR family transcriptional regulator